MEATETKQLVSDYLQAFSDRDLDKCLKFFAPDASIEWMMGTYAGTDSIRQWHQDRFDADLKVLGIESIEAEGDCVTVELLVNSKRLAAWRIPTIAGRVTVELDNHLIRRSKFAVKSINPQQNWS